MNTTCKNEVKKTLKRYCAGWKHEHRFVLDFGSLDINGSHRSLIPASWKYTGLDLVKGPNVDMLMREPYRAPFAAEVADVVLCGQVLEHVRHPFKLVTEMGRVLKPRGYLIIHAPFIKVQHRKQANGMVIDDCFRFLPDGYSSMFEEAHLKEVKSYLIRRRKNVYCFGIATK
jgi:SAM-dependent methyltransferase